MSAVALRFSPACPNVGRTTNCGGLKFNSCWAELQLDYTPLRLVTSGKS